VVCASVIYLSKVGGLKVTPIFAHKSIPIRIGVFKEGIVKNSCTSSLAPTVTGSVTAPTISAKELFARCTVRVFSWMQYLSALTITMDHLVIDKRSLQARIQERTVCLPPKFYRYMAAAGSLLGFCRGPGGVFPGPDRVSHERVAVLSKDAILIAPGAKFLRRSFAIKPHVASLLAFPAALFSAVRCCSHRGSGGSFLFVPEFSTLLLNGLVLCGSGAQFAEAGDVIEAYVQLILRMHILVQSVYLIFLGEVSDSAQFVSMAVGYLWNGSSGRCIRPWISRTICTRYRRGRYCCRNSRD